VKTSAEEHGDFGTATPASDTTAVEAALRRLAGGGLVLLLDDSGPHSWGVLVAAADAITPAVINFMVVHGRGLVCAPIPGQRLDELGIPMMVAPNDTSGRLPFAVSVDARIGTTTGTSAADRAATVRVLVSPRTRPADLVRPGHILPIRTVPGGVLSHMAYPEAVVDLVRMAGLSACGVTCEVLSEGGEMAAAGELAELAATHGLPTVTLRAVARHRIATERLTWDGLWPPSREGAREVTREARPAPGAPAASPASPLSGVAGLITWVTDQDRAVDFYVGKLGLVKLRDNEYGPGLRYIEVGVPGSDMALVLLRRSGTAAASPERLAPVILGTEDIMSAFELLQSRGVPFRCAPIRQSWGGIHAEFVDPDGNVFVLSQR
jgi:3,4-dihydroxy-2-butanone 4-phosphate synthase